MQETLFIILAIGGFAVFGAVILKILFSSSTHLYRYDFRKEIETDLNSKGYKVMEIIEVPKQETSWKDKWDFNFLVRRRVVYKKVTIANEEGTTTSHYLRYHYNSGLPDYTQYNPPLHEDSVEEIDW